MDLNEKLAQRRKERENEATTNKVGISTQTPFEKNTFTQDKILLDDESNNSESTLAAIKERELKKTGVVVSNFQRAEEDAALNKRIEEMATERLYIEEKAFLALSVILVIVAFIDWWLLGFIAFSIFVFIYNAKLKKYRIKIIKEFELDNDSRSS